MPRLKLAARHAVAGIFSVLAAREAEYSEDEEWLPDWRAHGGAFFSHVAGYGAGKPVSSRKFTDFRRAPRVIACVMHCVKTVGSRRCLAGSSERQQKRRGSTKHGSRLLSTGLLPGSAMASVSTPEHSTADTETGLAATPPRRRSWLSWPRCIPSSSPWLRPVGELCGSPALLRLGLELVADAVARLQEGVARRARVDLLAELAHEHVYRAVAVRGPPPPHAL